MNILQKIGQDYRMINDSSIWLFDQMNQAIEDCDKAVLENEQNPCEETAMRLDFCIERMKCLIARCEIEIKNCDSFSKKYNIE